MEAFKVGQVVKHGSTEYEVVEVTDNLVAVHQKGSGMDIKWWEKNKIKGQISMGVFEVK